MKKLLLFILDCILCWFAAFLISRPAFICFAAMIKLEMYFQFTIHFAALVFVLFIVNDKIITFRQKHLN